MRTTLRNVVVEDPYASIGGSPFPFRSDWSNLKFVPGASYGFQDLDMRVGYTQQYNLSLQHQIGGDWTVEAAYVGNVGRKLIGQTDYNAPVRNATANKNNVDQRRPYFPALKDVRETFGGVNSSYNALQTRVERRFSHGFTFAGVYTLGKAIDESTGTRRRTSGPTYITAGSTKAGRSTIAATCSCSPGCGMCRISPDPPV